MYLTTPPSVDNARLMSCAILERRAYPLCCADRFADSVQRLIWIPFGEVKLSEDNLAICGCIGLEAKRARRHFLEHSIEDSSRIGNSPELQIGDGQPSGNEKNQRPVSDLPR